MGFAQQVKELNIDKEYFEPLDPPEISFRNDDYMQLKQNDGEEVIVQKSALGNYDLNEVRIADKGVFVSGLSGVKYILKNIFADTVLVNKTDEAKVLINKKGKIVAQGVAMQSLPDEIKAALLL